MSDFFSNLLVRSRANSPAILPRLPSRFEPSARLRSDFQSSEFEATASPISPPSVHSAPKSSANQWLATVPPNPENPSALGEQKPPAAANHPASFAAPPLDNTAEIRDSARKTIIPITAKLDEKNSRDAAKTKALQASSARPAFPSRPQNLISPNEPQPSAPAIHVTIGRVEVRAIHSAAPARKPVKSASPKLSLNEYLQKRDGGA